MNYSIGNDVIFNKMLILTKGIYSPIEYTLSTLTVYIKKFFRVFLGF